jgi:hypothetical protein
MKAERKKCSSPCATCPFLKSNFGKPSPEGFDPRRATAQHGRRFYDWYSLENLRRLWNGGIRKGEVMICHATDPGAEVYGGKSAAPGNERPCLGSIAVVIRHLKFIEGLIKEGRQPNEWPKLYRAAAGPYPLTKAGMFAWAMMVNTGRTDLLGGMPIPESLPAAAVEACGVPWLDRIAGERD